MATHRVIPPSHSGTDPRIPCPCIQSLGCTLGSSMGHLLPAEPCWAAGTCPGQGDGAHLPCEWNAATVGWGGQHGALGVPHPQGFPITTAWLEESGAGLGDAMGSCLGPSSTGTRPCKAASGNPEGWGDAKQDPGAHSSTRELVGAPLASGAPRPAAIRGARLLPMLPRSTASC